VVQHKISLQFIILVKLHGLIRQLNKLRWFRWAQSFSILKHCHCTADEILEDRNVSVVVTNLARFRYTCPVWESRFFKL